MKMHMHKVTDCHTVCNHHIPETTERPICRKVTE